MVFIDPFRAIQPRIRRVFPLLTAFLLGIPLALSAADATLDDAKAHLKSHLKELHRQYPFDKWEKGLRTTQKGLREIQERSQGTQAGDPRHAKALARLEKWVGQVEGSRPHAEALIRELYVAVIALRVEEKLVREGKTIAPGFRLEFERALRPYEAGSLKPKTDFLAELAKLSLDFEELKENWLFAYAQAFLGKRIDGILQAHDYAKGEAVYDDFSLQLDYWEKQIAGNAVQAQVQLDALARKWSSSRAGILNSLHGLSEALDTDMLFSQLLAQAGKDGVEFTVQAESRIENGLAMRHAHVKRPVQERIQAWNTFETRLQDRLSVARSEASRQQSQAVARAEQERLERERLEALRAEQARREREQKEQFRKNLVALKTFSFKGDTHVELADGSEKALSTDAGFLKTSYVASGKKRLKVDKEKFSDTLAFVDRFEVDEAGMRVGKMSLSQRGSESAYTYASPGGRTTPEDLERFVQMVALGSFESEYNFRSYLAPERWTPGQSLAWKPDRHRQPEVKDREFSYVDLVVDAHRVRTGGDKGPVAKANLPANMIVLFDDRGGIRRFQSFSRLEEVRISPQELVGGKLFYKFLNYSVDRRNIYLNGIDPEVKVSAPSGRS